MSERTTAYEQAKRIQDNAMKEAKAIRNKSDAHLLELKKIADLASDLQQQMLKASRSIEHSFPELRVAANSFVEDINKMSWANSIGASSRFIQELFQDNSVLDILPSSFSIGRPFANNLSTKSIADVKRDSELLGQLIQALETDRKACLNEFTTLTKTGKDALQRRGEMLLGHSVCSELDLD